MESFKEFKLKNNLGEFVQDVLSKVDTEQKDFILRIIGDYLKDINPHVNLYNSLNILPDNEKGEIRRRINLYLDDHQGDVDIVASVNSNEIIQESYGKNVINTFFKCLTALGLKENTPSSEHKGDFLFLYWFPELDPNRVKDVFNRFKSLSLLEIDWTTPISLYFGLNINGNFQYGWSSNDDLSIIGEFKLTKSNLDMLKTLNFKSSSDLKRLLSNLSLDDINLALKILPVLNDFDLHYQKRTGILFTDKILTRAYLGVDQEIEDIRVKFKQHLQGFKWSSRVMLSVKAENLWLYLQIKIK